MMQKKKTKKKVAFSIRNKNIGIALGINTPFFTGECISFSNDCKI